MSFEDFVAKAEQHRPKAAILVHIGGHLAFDVERIAAYCREKGSSCSRTAPMPTARAGTVVGREVGRRGRLLLVRDEDDLHR